MPTPPSSAALLEPLSAWFQEHRRDLPWRAENLDTPHPDPYAVLVSELMLQQTQVSTVVPYFLRWMAKFPNPAALAEADDDEVHKLWEGLGYYRRARFLKQTAAIIAQQGWPRNAPGLMALPGLGPYTAAAMASIAFQLPEPALDGNAFRVLARLMGLHDQPKTHAKELSAWLKPALEGLGPSRITQAIMELGALVCSPRPDCDLCPLKTSCEACRQGITNHIPPPRTRTSVKTVRLWLVAMLAENHWLVLRPTTKGLLSGLWRWPGIELPQASEVDVAAETIVPYQALEVRGWKGWTQIYSHRRETVAPIFLELSRMSEAPAGCAWVPDQALPDLPMGRRDQRLRDLLCTETRVDVEDIPAARLVRSLLKPIG